MMGEGGGYSTGRSESDGMTDHHKSPVPSFVAIAVVICASLGAYVGAYLSSASNVTHFAWSDYAETAVPEYPIGSPVAGVVFFPAHMIDRQLRPKYWEDCECDWLARALKQRIPPG